MSRSAAPLGPQAPHSLFNRAYSMEECLENTIHMKSPVQESTVSKCVGTLRHWAGATAAEGRSVSSNFAGNGKGLGETLHDLRFPSVG